MAVWGIHPGDWLALKFSSELKDRLSRQFQAGWRAGPGSARAIGWPAGPLALFWFWQVSGIPQLIVIDGVGRQARTFGLRLGADSDTSDVGLLQILEAA